MHRIWSQINITRPADGPPIDPDLVKELWILKRGKDASQVSWFEYYSTADAVGKDHL
jgi:hypothetical protein